MFKRVTRYGMILMLMGVSTAYALNGMDVFARHETQEKKKDLLANTLVLVQTMTDANMETQVTLYKKGKKSRIETILKKSPNPMVGEVGMKTIIIDDGKSTWVFSPLTGKMEEPNSQDGEENKKPREVEYISKETVSGIECYKIKAIYNEGEYEVLWIDIRNDALVKKEYFDGEEKEIIINSDFKTTKGFVFPWQMRVESEGGVQKMVVNSLKVNPSIPDSLFDPGQVKGYDDAAPDTQEAMQQADKMMDMITEIQRLYQNGETKKAEALEKKMQQMMQGN
ncbi:MAG: outer membrane lipoprotein-sorting protein [Proteobacteria bacterium]|nr:outer membrane lipoprotein-sorting protein [Pseudomonadota bacterium]MBU4130572.1 outer membrane lipoprotein-sorting protein [Pseudomonadota bacterium]